MDLKVILFVIFAIISHGKESLYELALSDEDLFSACPDTASATRDIQGLVDLSEFSTTLVEDGMIISGNLSFVWDIQPQDRVKVINRLFYFDRGTWTPTFFSAIAHDYCKSIYDSSQVWYAFWPGHVKNVEDVRDKCVYPGTKIFFESYLLSFIMNMTTIREGLYKLQYTWQAFDSDGTERPTNICFNILGNLQRK